MVEIFFKLIRSGLYGTELKASDLPSDIDWKQIVALARSQTMEGVLADAVMRLPSDVVVPEAVKSQLMDSALRIAKSHALLDSSVADLVKFYNAHGIDTVLLKGQGIARCYRNPSMRQCGDIDLYIGKENYQRACELARQKLETGEKDPAESVKHYHFNIGQVEVELHRIAATSISIHYKDFRKWNATRLSEKDKLRYIDIKGEKVPLPSPLFDAFFIFYHAWRHLLYGGIGLRQISDWVMLMDKYYDQVDLKELEKALRHFGLMKPWQIFGYIAVEYLGLPQHKMPFFNPSMKKKGQMGLELILEGGNFGFYSKEHIPNLRQLPFFVRKTRLLRKSLKNYSYLFPIVPIGATSHFISSLTLSTYNTIGQILTGRKF